MENNDVSQPPPLRRFIRRKLVREIANIELSALIAPDSYWPQPVSIEQAFQVLRMMVKTGEKYETPTRWGRQSVRGLLSKSPTCTGHSQVAPILSLDDLRERFHWALLSRHACEAAKRWRADYGWTPTSNVDLTFPHFKPFDGPDLALGKTRYGGGGEAAIKEALETLFKRAASTPLAVSPNSCHLRAREPAGLSITVWTKGFVFNVNYGLEGSRWDFPIATVDEDEPFVLGLERAIAYYALLVNDDGLDEADLVRRLNTIERPHHWHKDDGWVQADTGPAYVWGTRYDDLLVHSPPGGDKGAKVSHIPSGRMLFSDPEYRWEQLKAAVEAAAKTMNNRWSENRVISTARKAISAALLPDAEAAA